MREHCVVELPPLVVITAWGQTPDPAVESDLGVAAILTKPIKQMRLVACLAKAIQVTPTAAAADSPATEDTTIYRRRHGLGRQRVLLVEENSSARKLIIQLLEQIGFRADPACNGAEAIESLTRLHYPVVLLNCQMSEMDGLETARTIRQLEGAHAHQDDAAMSYILGISSRMSDPDIEAYSRAGLDDCIPLPVRKEDLKQAMAQAVSRLRKTRLVPITDQLEHDDRCTIASPKLDTI